VKTGPTPPMVGNGYQDRQRIAEGPLRGALEVTRPEDLEGKYILVYDDVFTDGPTLNEIARALRGAGATDVCGITLCPQPFGGQAFTASALVTVARQGWATCQQRNGSFRSRHRGRASADSRAETCPSLGV
jgi:hypothetical protein